jgi:hypothetical protein
MCSPPRVESHLESAPPEYDFRENEYSPRFLVQQTVSKGDPIPLNQDRYYQGKNVRRRADDDNESILQANDFPAERSR